MRRFGLYTLFAFLYFPVFGQPGELIWEDNFDEGFLNTATWNYETGTGVNGDWGTGQIDRSSAENISFKDSIPGAENGCLVITTEKKWLTDRNYSSGRINTSGKVAWGPGHRIVAKIYPRDVRYQGQGFAFWMMPNEIPAGWDYLMWPQGGEIDIMEYVGAIPHHNLGSVHYAWFWENNQWQSWNHGHKGFYYSFETNQVPNPSEPGYGNFPPEVNDPNAGSYGFHEYGIDWYNDRIEFFIDNHVYHIHYLEDGGAFKVDGQDQDAIQTINNNRVGVSEYSNHFNEWYPFENEMYIILSAGVGGQNYTYGGAIVPEAEFPCSVFIDWVKVFKLDNSSSISANKSKPYLSVYPNPTTRWIQVEMNQSAKNTVTVYNSQGNKILTFCPDEMGRIDLSALAKGTYLIKAENGELSATKKIVLK